LAMRRLRSPFAGIVFAAAYLLFPALQAAVTDDFHAVTLSVAFLLFALYFMLSRNNVGLVIACLLALSTKEEIPLDVALIGLSIVVLQPAAASAGAWSGLRWFGWLWSWRSCILPVRWGSLLLLRATRSLVAHRGRSRSTC